MAVKPILFNTKMVQAILEGRKTVTRRVIKTVHKNATGFYVCRNSAGEITGICDYDEDERMFADYTNPPFAPGDILYVRETWSKFRNVLSSEQHYEQYVYKASDEYLLGENHIVKFRWHPSIHMPKEAARIKLDVKAVRIARLQDMTPQDSLDEGVKLSLDGIMRKGESPLAPFARVWDSTVREQDLYRYGWEANPWVWVIEFERYETPEEP